MPLKLVEWFGSDIKDVSVEAERNRLNQWCPFIDSHCTKTFNDGSRNGICSVEGIKEGVVVICPNRLYAEHYWLLEDVAKVAFGDQVRVVHPRGFGEVPHDGNVVVAFGKKFGGEVRLPNRQRGGSYFVDWILARINTSGRLAEFVALEIQTIDTTGSYKPEVEILRTGKRSVDASGAGLNWENVNKRILPQLIYKGHVLRRERLCSKGLFFACPSQVYSRISNRLGGKLLDYSNIQPGSITFRWYSLGEPDPARKLVCDGQFSTTVDQVALAFTAPVDLPEPGVYERVIDGALRILGEQRSLPTME